MTDRKELESVIRCITAVYQPQKILLFGSRARGTSTVESDIDICVLYDHLPKRTLEILQELYRSLYTIPGIPAVDVLVFQSDTYRVRAQQRNTIEHEIHHTGRVIYGQD